MFAGPRVVRRRPLLRAAAVGGTAYAVGRRSAQARSAEAQSAEASQQSAPPPQAVSPESSMMDQLGQLNTLHQQGALTDEEFAAAKARLLAS